MSSREVRIEVRNEVRRINKVWAEKKKRWEKERALLLEEVAALKEKLKKSDPLLGLKLLEVILNESRIPSS
jgi:hypothetical protein